MKSPASSTALAPVRRIADMIPAAQPVFDSLCMKLMAQGKNPAFYAEARNFLRDASHFAAQNGQPMLASLYDGAANQMHKKAVAHG